MNGIDIADPELVWTPLLHRIGAIKERGHLTRPELATLAEEAMKEQGAPARVWRYVGKRIRDEVHGGDGGRPADPYKRWAAALNLEIELRPLEAAFKIQGKKGVRERALRIVARGQGITTDTLRRKLRKNLRDLPRALQVPRKDGIDFESVVRELLDEDIVRLDPDLGLVWLNQAGGV